MLKSLWEYLVKPALIILTITLFCKSLFLFKNSDYLQNEAFSEIFRMYTNSLSLDFAILSYLLLLPALVWFLQQLFYTRNFIYLFSLMYFGFLFLITFTISFIDIELFSYWTSKLSAKALSFLNTPTMAFKSAGKGNVALLSFLIFTSSYFVYYLYQLNLKKITFRSKYRFWSLLVFPFIVGILILGLRGGLREIPINQSDAYYSQNQVLNVAGVNSLWNMGNVLFQNRNSLTTNPYKTMSQEKAVQIFQKLYTTPKDTSISLFNKDKPNIVYLALEGVNANCIKAFNTKNNYMPQVSELMQEAYTFKNMFASGMRTDQGLVAVLSGFPALPLHTIGAQPEKFQSLPSLSLALQEKNYTNTFFFAGEPEFGSFKAFLIHNGFEKIYSFKDYKKEELSQELGAPDEFLFQKFLEDMQQPKEPFFSLLLTQTTHEPFDMPFNQSVREEADRYINTVKYVDEEIGLWITACKKFPWYANTIFIISSDHAHPLPEKYWYTDKERYHIPFIIFGGALKEEFKGKINDKLVNQTDIPLTLSKQLNLKNQNFEFSKNFSNPYSPEFSSFIHIHGHNWIRKDGNCSVNYEIVNDFEDLNKEGNVCTLENAAYFQYVFQKYMDY